MSLSKQGVARLAAMQLTNTRVEAVTEQYIDWMDEQEDPSKAMDALAAAAKVSKSPERVLVVASEHYESMPAGEADTALADAQQVNVELQQQVKALEAQVAALSQAPTTPTTPTTPTPPTTPTTPETTTPTPTTPVTPPAKKTTTKKATAKKS